MITTQLTTDTIETMLTHLCKKFEGTLTKDLNDYVLAIDNEIGYGTVRGIALKGGISYLEFDMEFNQDVALAIKTLDNSPIYFTYCSEGSISHTFASEGKKRKLESFQTAITTCKDGEESHLNFGKNKQIRVSLITVQRSAHHVVSDEFSLTHNVEHLFIDQVANNTMYIGSYNLKIAEKIQQLNAITQKGIVRNLLVEGLVSMILALEIQQHSDDRKNANLNSGSLTTLEMQSVKEVSEFVNNFSETQLSIDKLSRKSGLSAAKLQEGFKLMHGHTINDYVRDVRVRKSEYLIRTTDMNISEVVYSVGLTSRSYFSKIFKAKYKCSPKAYKNGQRVAMTA